MIIVNEHNAKAVAESITSLDYAADLYLALGEKLQRDRYDDRLAANIQKGVGRYEELRTCIEIAQNKLQEVSNNREQLLDVLEKEACAKQDKYLSDINASIVKSKSEYQAAQKDLAKTQAEIRTITETIRREVWNEVVLQARGLTKLVKRMKKRYGK